MVMKDTCIQALALNQTVRVFLLRNTNTVNTAIDLHNLWPSATSVLGKLLSMGQMMGLMMKGDEGLTIKVNGNGAIQKAVVDANSKGEVRGFVSSPEVNFVNNSGGLNDEFTIGNDGIIEVIKDLKLKDLFASSVRLHGNIASDFTYYFYESEQVPSLISLGILVDNDNTCKISGGIIIQLLPNASENEIKYLEDRAYLLNNFSNTLLEKNDTEILNMIFNNDFEILKINDVCFKCNCSKESFANSLKTLGIKTLKELKDEDHKIEANCYYCNKTYTYNEDEIEQMIKSLEKGK